MAITVSRIQIAVIPYVRSAADLPSLTAFIVLLILNLKVYLTNTPANVMKVGQERIALSGLDLALSFV